MAGLSLIRIASIIRAGRIAALALASLSALAPHAAAQFDAEGSLPYPPGLSMPINLVGIDAEASAKAKLALRAAESALANAWLTAPTTLTQAVGKRPILINSQKITGHIYAGAPRQAFSKPVTVEPTWCEVMDRHVFFLTVVDTETNDLLASRHVAVPRDAWDGMQKPAGAQEAFLKAKLAALASGALQDAATRMSRPITDAMHVGLSMGAAIDRNDEGSSFCTDMLIEEQLAKDYTVARQLGNDHLALVRGVLGQPSHLRRPTRQVVIRWSNPPLDAPRRMLPTHLAVDITLAEAVYGKHLPQTYQGSWELKDAPDQRLSLAVDPRFLALLNAEKAALNLADWPQVTKVDRAWVYLDRGRAWGLKMDDRLVAMVGGKLVTGHVVHFYGPEANLKSPRGFPVSEGAILFIRKNQKLPRVGTEFRMDPKTYPAPYPPTAAK